MKNLCTPTPAIASALLLLAISCGGDRTARDLEAGETPDQAIGAAALQGHADAVAQYRSGKRQTFGFLVGQVMKGSGGRANPKLASDLLKRALES